MGNSLKGKVALVTGGSRGIGAAIANRFAKEGAIVAISYLASLANAKAVVERLEQEGYKAAAFYADQADGKQISSLIQSVVKMFGKIDILVPNAGVFVGGAVDSPELDIQALDRQFAINLTGVVTTVREAVHEMNDGGRIILIGSIVGDRTAFARTADYSGTKAALAGYTHGWCRDLGPRNITVNLIQPGPIDTDMNPAEGEHAKKMKQGTALGRYGSSDEIAAAVAFLAGPDASYITGSTLTVDGGYNA